MGARIVAAVAASMALASLSAVARAGPCGDEAVELESSLQHASGAVGTARQSLDAQLERQPTPASVEKAKQAAKTEIATLLDQAKAFDAENRQDECANALAKAKLLLNP